MNFNVGQIVSFFLIAIVALIVIIIFIKNKDLFRFTSAAPVAVTGEQTDRTNLSFTGSGYTSEYHLYAAGLDFTKPVGLLIYTDGSAEFGLKNPEDSYLLAGSNGMIAVAKKHNMILLTPFAPNKDCEDGDGSCWYQGDPPGYVNWLEGLVSQVQSQYPIDKARIAFGGYSSGAQLATEYWVPSGAAQRTMDAGVIVAISFGGSPKMAEVGYTAAFKSSVHMNWNVGEDDDSYLLNDETEGPEEGYNAKAGYDHYTSAGFQTSIDLIPGLDHDRDDFGSVMDAQIAAHIGGSATIPAAEEEEEEANWARALYVKVGNVR